MGSASSRGRSAAIGARGAAQLTSVCAWNAMARVPGVEALNARKGQMMEPMSAHPPQLCQRDGASAMLPPCPTRCY